MEVIAQLLEPPVGTIYCSSLKNRFIYNWHRRPPKRLRHYVFYALSFQGLV